eukprot:TRINITY_DN2712_c0_g1_i1.p1 TRINITY_DN2712_c0_g1~~TRINITY_DN2712_c0_g1_i1.p1  ORF type:complete len:306 (+),score=42.28 TRINITY_DN2712_c0_g1_i1:358-1275(+)
MTVVKFLAWRELFNLLVELLAKTKKKNYTVSDQIGKGGFGKVFLAVADNKKIALKKIPHETTRQKRKNFQEIRFLKYCDHPNILKLDHASLMTDEMWLATEFLEGGTLTKAVQVRHFTEPEIAYVAYHMLNAIKYLHENMLAHRDLKSANIMLLLNGGIKLIDFGLCSDISQGQVVHMVGSPFWMPPEMIRRQPHGLLVDIWSFGICLIECAIGRPPNYSSPIKAMFVAATEGYPEPVDPMKWSPLFIDFLSKCLQISPEHRWSASKLLEHKFLTKSSSVDEIVQSFGSFFKSYSTTVKSESVSK